MLVSNRHINLINFTIFISRMFTKFYIIDAALSFSQETKFTTGSRLIDAIVDATIISSLSCFPDVGFLSRFSVFGLLAILLTFIIITIFGVEEYGLSGFTTPTLSDWLHNLIPEDPIPDTTMLFGIVLYSYGLTPIVFNIQESMNEPSRMLEATKKGLGLASFVYAVVGIFVGVLFSLGDASLKGDVLQYLPTDKAYASVIRVAMTVMVLVTAPLLVIPCGDILEGKLQSSECLWLPSHKRKYCIRFCICIFGAVLAARVPDFVHIVGFIGGCFVSFTTFVAPPLLCLILSRSKSQDTRTIDYIALTLGIGVTMLVSYQTFESMVQAIQN